MKTVLLLLVVASVAACGDSKARFLIAPATETTELRLRVSSIEVRDVSLPAYAAASEIVVEDADGALRPVAKALWADDPVRGVTGALARSLDVKSNATVSAEPWPLAESPAVRVEVRIEQMIARNNGSFTLTGQFALSSPSGAVRDTLQRFAIEVPLTDTAPANVAKATGAAINALADEILARLKR